MRRPYLLNGLAGATALVIASAHFVPGSARPGKVLSAAPVLAAVPSVTELAGLGTENGLADARVTVRTRTALAAFRKTVRPLSHPEALETAFTSYFAYLSKNPDKVKKPYLYFVDYGLPMTKPRGYVFDMEALRVVDGPFAVAHGSGSGTTRDGKPARFSNRHGSNATSLGLYLAQELYTFHGKMAGRPYRAVGLRMTGLSGEYNSNARSRRVVAHGAPYVTDTRAGRSQGCPALEPSRARRLLPKLADGGLVFLFAPDEEWMRDDPWIIAGNGVASTE
jgi:hypothetical protein